MARGFKTGGRRKGSRNKAGLQILSKKAAALNMTPLDYLISVYTDELAERHERIDAAKAAAPYIHKKQPQEQQLTGKDGKTAVLNIITSGGK